MATLPVSSSYREAIFTAVILQVVTTLFLLTILDGGMLAKAGGAAMAGFWIGVAIVMLRRPRDPNKLNLLYIRWGYLAMLVIAVLCLPFMGILRG